jgi:uncharacterized membrane protein
MWDFDDFDEDDIINILCWASIVIFSIVGLITIFPTILYIVIILGIGIPAYFLIKKKNR